MNAEGEAINFSKMHRRAIAVITDYNAEQTNSNAKI